VPASVIGAKAPILDGAQFSTLVIPFIEVSKENDFEDVVDVIEKVWDWWMEVGKNRERVGETMQRIGLPHFLSVMEVEPLPQHVKEPRSNPYVFWKEEEVEGGWERDVVSSGATQPDRHQYSNGTIYKEIYSWVTIRKSYGRSDYRLGTKILRRFFAAGNQGKQRQMALS
jgi:hypothetical protein